MQKEILTVSSEISPAIKQESNKTNKFVALRDDKNPREVVKEMYVVSRRSKSTQDFLIPSISS